MESGCKGLQLEFTSVLGFSFAHMGTSGYNPAPPRIRDPPGVYLCLDLVSPLP